MFGQKESLQSQLAGLSLSMSRTGAKAARMNSEMAAALQQMRADRDVSEKDLPVKVAGYRTVLIPESEFDTMEMMIQQAAMCARQWSNDLSTLERLQTHALTYFAHTLATPMGVDLGSRYNVDGLWKQIVDWEPESCSEDGEGPEETSINQEVRARAEEVARKGMWMTVASWMKKTSLTGGEKLMVTWVTMLTHQLATVLGVKTETDFERTMEEIGREYRKVEEDKVKKDEVERSDSVAED